MSTVWVRNVKMNGLGQDAVECALSSLDSLHRTWLGSTLVVTGVFGAAVNGWLMSTIMLSHHLTEHTMLILLNLAVSCLGRTLLGGFPFAAASLLAGRWLFGYSCCQLFAFLRQFFSIAQLSTLTLLSVERLVIRRHSNLGRRLSVSVYVWSVVACWLAAILWSAPPLFSVGRYDCGDAGVSCDLDWSRSTEPFHVGFNLSLLLIGYLLPTLITLTCVWRAATGGRTQMTLNEDGIIQVDQNTLNRTTAALVTAMYLLWTPTAIATMWTWFEGPRLIEYGERVMSLPTSLIVMAPLSAEFASLMPVVVYIAFEPKLRRALFGVIGKNEMPSPIRIKRSKRRVRITLPKEIK